MEQQQLRRVGSSRLPVKHFDTVDFNLAIRDGWHGISPD
jgi:hypothetical protein